MSEIRVGRWKLNLDVTMVNGRTWWVCPIGGDRCGLVLTELGAVGIDCMAWHVEHAHRTSLVYLTSR